MTETATIHTRAASAECLARRIEENTAAQQTDLGTWIFERVPVPEGARVLELCCGTGAQTAKLAARVGATGQVVAVDISAQALQDMLARLPQEERARVVPVEANLDDFAGAVTAAAGEPSFDLVFCAYGLYYAQDAARVLDQVHPWLRPGGQIVVCGPFGPNNGALFGLLEENGVTLSPYVKFTSQDFMKDVVIPWSAVHFKNVALDSLTNPVVWSSPDKILSYWEHSTFYAAERRPAVEEALARAFAQSPQFINEKWVMLARMTDARR